VGYPELKSIPPPRQKHKTASNFNSSLKLLAVLSLQQGSIPFLNGPSSGTEVAVLPFSFFYTSLTTSQGVV
jgi:hypothetical protein